MDARLSNSGDRSSQTAEINKLGKQHVSFKLQSLGFQVTNANPQEPESSVSVVMPQGDANVDIRVVTSVRAHREYARRPEFNHYEWPVDSDVRQSESGGQFFAFVDLAGCTDSRTTPIVFIIRADDVARLIPDDWAHPALWLSDSVANQYRERWDAMQKAFRE